MPLTILQRSKLPKETLAKAFMIICRSLVERDKKAAASQTDAQSNRTPSNLEDNGQVNDIAQ